MHAAKGIKPFAERAERAHPPPVWRRRLNPLFLLPSFGKGARPAVRGERESGTIEGKNTMADRYQREQRENAAQPGEDMQPEDMQPQSVQGQRPPADKSAAEGARLPRRARVVNHKGEKIGTVRGGVWYDNDQNALASFHKQENNVHMYDAAKAYAGYVDVHDDIRTAGGEYVASLRYFRWGILAILAIALTLVTMVAVIFGSFGIGRSGMGALAQEPIFFIVEDTEERTGWTEYEDIPIFYNEQFGDRLALPGTKSVYRFRFINNNAHALRFSFTFSEENEYGIEMVYTLQRDGVYIAGSGEEYVTAPELSFAGFTIEGGSESLFELCWYWKDNDPVDTNAGENEAIYRLNIEFNAEVAEAE